MNNPFEEIFKRLENIEKMIAPVMGAQPEERQDGKEPFQITKFDVTHHSQEVKDQFEDLEGKSVVLAGRMMSKRVMGKASFCNIHCA